MKCKQCKREIAEGSTFCNWCGKKQVSDKKRGEVPVPEPRQLSSGKWFIQLRFNGVSTSVTEETKELCLAKARAIKTGLITAKTMPKNTTLKEALNNYISSRSNSLSPSTIRGYNQIRDNRFKAVMNKQIANITDWQKICNAEAKLCSAKTLKNSWMFVASVLKETTGEPAPVVKLPQVVPKERPWLEPDQITIFVKAVQNQKCQIPALLALHSLRRSEVCALTWDKIDLKKNQILVSGAAVFDKDHKLVQKDTNKNQSSRRYVPIMIDELFEALKESENKTGLVVTCSPNTVWAQVNRICKANNLPQVGVHGLRHSFASLAYHLGMPEKVAMQIGGWSDRDTMSKIYTHLAQMDISKYETKMTEFYKKSNKKDTKKAKGKSDKKNTEPSL